MRKVRDYDAELKALGDKARALKAKRIEQLGQLVAATGADALNVEELAGALLDAVSAKDPSVKEAWRAKGAAFFQGRGRKIANGSITAGSVDLRDGSGAQTESGRDTAGGSGGSANG
jgi:hypothetical protein